MAEITLEQAIALVNAGGWKIVSGHDTECAKPTTTVTGAAIHGDVLHLRCDLTPVAAANIDRLTVDMVGEDRPRRLNFNGPMMVKLQRKNTMGGGCHEEERVSCLLLLVNVAAEEQHEAEQAKKREQARLEAEAKLAAERKRRAEERDARVLSFLAHQKEQIAGSHVVDLIGDRTSLTIRFDNGYELKVVLDGRDTNCAWIDVVGDGQKINLESGRPPW